MNTLNTGTEVFKTHIVFIHEIVLKDGRCDNGSILH